MARLVREESPLEVSIKGALAGLAGTVVLTLAMQNVGRLLPPSAQGGPAERAGGESPDPPTERLAEKVASGVFETELSPDVRQTLGMGIHWGYGAFWGLLYGLVQSSLRLPVWLHGPLFGVIVWVVGPLGLIPAMKLADTPADRPTSGRLVSIGLHQVFGWTVAGAFHLLSRDA